MPGQHGDPASCGDNSDLGSAASSDPLVECTQGAWCLYRCPRRFDYHPSSVRASLFGNRPIRGRLDPGLPDTRIETEVPNQLGRGRKALNIPDGSDEREGDHGVDARDRDEATDLRVFERRAGQDSLDRGELPSDELKLAERGLRGNSLVRWQRR